MIYNEMQPLIFFFFSGRGCEVWVRLWGKKFLMFIKFMLLGNEKQRLHPAMSSLQTCGALRDIFTSGATELLTVNVTYQSLT